MDVVKTEVIKTKLPGVIIIEPKVFGDNRGYFYETFQRERYRQAGLTQDFVQDNLSFSQQGVVRGMHYQLRYPQGKLVSVMQGTVYDVVVDIRAGSPQFGEWVGVELSLDNHRQLYVPPGCAHGFCVLSDTALFHYKCTDYYHPEDEFGLLWNDSAVNIDWPLTITPALSVKDSVYPLLKDIAKEHLPIFKG